MLFDGNDENANLNGIEYIISEKLFETLPAEERKYWHPHNAEIFSGQLVAPNIPETAEKAFMKQKLNSYGKTIHVWMAHAGHKVPMGEPTLAWSFNRDGKAKPGLVEDRDKGMDIDSDAKRRSRKDLLEFAKPQEGVDALKGKFGRPTREIPGVKDKKAR